MPLVKTETQVTGAALLAPLVVSQVGSSQSNQREGKRAIEKQRGKWERETNKNKENKVDMGA